MKEVSLSASLHKEPVFRRFVDFKEKLEERIRTLRTAERIICVMVVVSTLLLATAFLGVGSLLGVYVPSVIVAVVSFACLLFLTTCLVGLASYKYALLNNKRKMEKVFDRIAQYDQKASEVSAQREDFVKEFLKESVSLAVSDFKNKVFTKNLLQQAPLGIDPLVSEWVDTAFASCPHVKENIRVKGQGFDAVSKLRRLFPFPAAVRYPGRFLSRWRDKPEFIHHKSPALAINLRCKREWLFILLGFFTLQELEELAAYVKTFSEGLLVSRGVSDEGTSLYSLSKGSISTPDEMSVCEQRATIYAACIKRFPKLVAAEAAFFFWLQQSFAYLFSVEDSLFFRPADYCTAFFDALVPFLDSRSYSELERHGLDWLGQFQGVLPACLALFAHRDTELSSVEFPYLRSTSLYEESIESGSEAVVDYSVMDEWGWVDFCDSTMDYCNATLFQGDHFGTLENLVEYVQKRGGREERDQSKESLDFPRSPTNFFDNPTPLWEMNTLCNQDAELLLKIDEGLHELYRSGYLGSFSVEEIQAFAKEILGLGNSE
ncbi:hypothetical protein [Chlamydiifrater phoenicopteri]|uniref:hypothetical protein n=1 Tax=Chlamydiifrater phoenicopteri TaxID=2681469 RepID=UPI001BCEB7EF|nr:hypothetical protein [Chlamydiifrater phoenicopteri]